MKIKRYRDYLISTDECDECGENTERWIHISDLVEHLNDDEIEEECSIRGIALKEEEIISLRDEELIEAFELAKEKYSYTELMERLK